MNRNFIIVVVVLLVCSTLWILANTSQSMPRCPNDMQALGWRCCAQGQRFQQGQCMGKPTVCPLGFDRNIDSCVAQEGQIYIAKGVSSWAPPDTTVQGEQAHTEQFWIDRIEVTWARYQRCVDSKSCAKITTEYGGDPSQAVHSITRKEARLFCRWAEGRLPHDSEWLRAALGDRETRYPWGDPDAFCTRAVYALENGPCAYEAKGPDTAGARPYGATPLGIQDIAGNVAEWIEDEAPNSLGIVRGGSFREHQASMLRARWRRVIEPNQRFSWVGFRCVYDHKPDFK